MDILWILFGLLKIIGFVLLGILGLLLFILFSILCSPIRYQLAGEKMEEIEGSFDVRWLFRIIHLLGWYDTKAGFRMEAKIFGIPILGRKRKKKKQRRKEVEVPRYEKPFPDLSMESRSDEPPEESSSWGNMESGELDEPETPEVPKEEAEEPQNKVLEDNQSWQEEPPKAKTSGIRRIPMVDIIEEKPKNWEQQMEDGTFFEEERFQEESIEEKESIFQNPHIQYFLHLPDKKKLLHHILVFIRRLFRGVFPKDVLVKATIGTGDPSLTGYLLAAVGMAKVKFGDSLQIKGDFARLALENVVLSIKGKIRIGYLLWVVIRFVLIKDIRKIIWHYWKGDKEHGK